ncbi:DoxX family protein [Coraliomargarita sp. SDUM461003]|uniref:DoxX family protein n=1 Tax=Thalassobacterium maritimum TaxID=3041265 RepID=A0ABU1AYL7_9BACT|nr:DoxX family protein [Coraliomargarita sp. SDUM461003]MDQ8209232.1 DoxX family protein [Coraliomargarita sp. SDUM461003]
MKIKEILLNTSNSIALLPIRLGVGVVMAAHGSQKLFGWFGGYGLEATGQFFSENLGLKPGLLMAAMAGGTEFVGGLLLIVGLMTRLAGLSLAGTMAVAILTAHSSAFFASNNGMEYPLTLLLASLTLAIGGGGAFSVDRKLAAK